VVEPDTYVIGLGGPIAKLIEKALRTGGETLSNHTGVSADIKLELIIKGKASGKLNLEFKEKEKISSTGRIKGDIGFTVKGLVEAGLDAFGVEAGAGAGFSSGAYKGIKKGGGTTSLVCDLSLKQAKQGEPPTFDGDIKTTGLAIYYAYYSYIRPQEDTKNRGTSGEGLKKGGMKKKKPKTKHTQKLEYNDKERIGLIEPFSFKESIEKHIG